MKQAERETQLLAACMRVAEREGYNRMTQQQIADEAGVSKQLPLHYFGNMDQLRRKVMREAVRTRNLTVLLQGLAHGDRYALRAPAEMQAAARAG